MYRFSFLFALLIFSAGVGTAFADGATVYIISPKDGDTVSPKFKVIFGLSGMGVAPAGVSKPNTGHHHLLIDAESLPPAGKAMGKSDHLKHFGGGQTETTLELATGKHTLQLVVGNHVHVPLSPSVASKKITITVK